MYDVGNFLGITIGVSSARDSQPFIFSHTRHSSAIALRRTPEEIKRATMHSTNKAFERYFRMESDDLRDIYSDTTKNRGQVIKLRKRKGKK